ncbi:MAG: ABC transporter substrate-binding protein [Spirochaetaceae bacterium]
MKIYNWTFLLLSLILVMSCRPKNKKNDEENQLENSKKVVIVHSYHDSVGGVITKNESLLAILNRYNIIYDIIYLDTRRVTDEDKRLEISINAYNKILEIQPDLVITFDDNAMKYLVKPYLRDSEIPIIFGGIDWDASVYELPYKNTTGIVSVDLIEPLIKNLKSLSSGDKVAWLGYEDLTSRKTIKAYKDVLDLNIDHYYVISNSEFKSQFINIQKEYDIVLLSGSLTNIVDWDILSITEFIHNNIKIPTGSVNIEVFDLSLILITKSKYELGNWIGKTAIKILQGAPVSDIDITLTTEANLYLNFELAELLDLSFPSELIKNMQELEN